MHKLHDFAVVKIEEQVERAIRMFLKAQEADSAPIKTYRLTELVELCGEAWGMLSGYYHADMLTEEEFDDWADVILPMQTDAKDLLRHGRFF